MTTVYPGSLDSLVNPTAGNNTPNPSHIAQHANANDAIEAIETELGTNPSAGAATVAARITADEGALTTHAGAADPHTGYRLESADHSHASTGLQAGTVAHSALTGLTSGDPHTQYQQESEKAAASGYASLDGSTKVPIAQVPTGTSGTTVALGNHGHTFVGCRAYNSTTQTVTAGAEATVLFDSEEYDTDTIHSTSSNTGRFTVPAGMGGKWRFTFHFTVLGSHGLVYAFLRIDGTTAVRGSELDEASETTDYSAFATVTQNLTAGQYIEARGFRGTGTTFGNTGNATMCSMEVEYLGA